MLEKLRDLSVVQKVVLIILPNLLFMYIWGHFLYFSDIIDGLLLIFDLDAITGYHWVEMDFSITLLFISMFLLFPRKKSD